MPRNPVSISTKTPATKALPESQILSIDTPDLVKAPTIPDEVCINFNLPIKCQRTHETMHNTK